MTMKELQKLVNDQGYITNIDDDGDIQFKVQGRHLFASVDKDDSSFVSIFTIFCIVPEGSQTDIDAYRAATKVESTLKCLSCIFLGTDDDGFNFRAAVECFTGGKNLAEHIGRYIEIVSLSGQRVLSALNGI